MHWKGYADRTGGKGGALGRVHMVAVITVCPCGGDGWGYAWPENGRFCTCSHGDHTLVH